MDTTIADYVDQPDQGLHSGLDLLYDVDVPGVVGADDGSLQFDQPIIDDLPAVDLPVDSDLGDAVIEIIDVDSDSSGFDIF